MNTIYISSRKKGFRSIIKSIFKNIDNAMVVNEIPHNFTLNKGKRRTEVKLDMGEIPLRDLQIENDVCSINIYHKDGFPISQVPLKGVNEVENLEYRVVNNQLILNLIHPLKKDSWFKRTRNKIQMVRDIIAFIKRLALAKH